MGCERCGGRIERYSLDGREAKVCADCGYVDVPVEHGRPSGPSESWREAFERFYDRFGESPPAEYPVRPVADDDDSVHGDGAEDGETHPIEGEDSSRDEEPRIPGEPDANGNERDAGPAVAGGTSSEFPEATDGGEPTPAESEPTDGLDGDGSDTVPSIEREN